MTNAVDQLLQRALALSDDQQLELAAALNAAVAERGLRAFDDSWLAEIQRRSAEYDAGQVETAEWDDVKRLARREILGESGA